jgi:benzaldehyde dehydrogenase (NAD)
VAFLDESTWRGKVYSGGWKQAAGGEAAVIEPATGAELGRAGIAAPADISAAAAIAAAAQPAWAALP